MLSLGEIRNSWHKLKHNKSNIQQTSSQHQTKWRETWSSPTKTRLPSFSLPIQYSTWSFSQSNSKKKWRSRGYKLERKKSKYHYLQIYDSLYKWLQQFHLLNLINSFSEVAGYKINSNISVIFLYIKDKQAEKENRETTSFTIVTRNINKI